MKTIKSFSYAWQGIRYCFFMETNFKIHTVLAFVTILCSIGFSISAKEWIVVIICIASVLALEMLNTAIEKLCDKLCPEINPQVKIIKDVAAGAVLVAAVASACIGTIIFFPYFFNYLNTIK